MNPKQEYAVLNKKTGEKVFFFKHSFKSALQHAEEYMKRNEGKFPMELIQL